nr:hypothetical protein 22 [Alphaproteobacteria bacterium]
MVAPLTLALYAIGRRSKAVRAGQRLQDEIDREREKEDRAYSREQSLIKMRIKGQEESSRRLGEEALERERMLMKERQEAAQRLTVWGIDPENTEKGLQKFSPEDHDYTTFNQQWLQFGNNDPQKVADTPDYEKIYINKTTGDIVNAFPEGQKDDHVFGGYRNKKDPSDIKYQPDPLLTKLLKKPEINVEPVTTEIEEAYAFDANGDKVTFTGPDARTQATKHLNKPKVREWYRSNDMKLEYTVEETVTTAKGDKTTSQRVNTSSVSPFAEAANKVAKEEVPTLVFQRPTVDGVTPDPIELISTTDTLREDLGKFDTELINLGITSPKAAKDMFAGSDTYNTSIRSLAGLIVQDASSLNAKTGRVVVNGILRTDPVAYMARFGGMRHLPNLIPALRQITAQSEVEDLEPIIQDNLDRTGNSEALVGTYPADSEGQATITVVSSLPDRYTGAVNEFKSRLVNDLKMTERQASTWIQDNMVAYVPDTDLQEVEANQPRLELLEYMFNKRVGGQPNGTLFYDVFKTVVNENNTSYNDVQKTVIRAFVAQDNGLSFDDKINFLQLITEVNTGSGAAALAYEALVGDPEADIADFTAEKRASAQAYANAKRNLVGFISTFYHPTERNPDGSPKLLPAGTQVSNVVLLADGAMYYADMFFRPLLQQVLGEDYVQGAERQISGRGEAVATMQQSLFGPRSQFNTFSTSATEAEQRAEAARRGMSYESFMERERAARQEVQEMFQTTAMFGDDEANLQYAMRAYYRFMTAYSLASAVQGGTGGRTISDQDVLNFLKAFNTDRYISDPALEVGVLKGVLESVEYQEKVALNIGRGGKVARATLKYMSFPGSGVDQDMMALARGAGVRITDAPPEDTGEDAAAATSSASYTADDLQKVIDGFPSFRTLNTQTPLGPVRTIDELKSINPTLSDTDIRNILNPPI